MIHPAEGHGVAVFDPEGNIAQPNQLQSLAESFRGLFCQMIAAPGGFQKFCFQSVLFRLGRSFGSGITVLADQFAKGGHGDFCCLQKIQFFWIMLVNLHGGVNAIQSTGNTIPEECFVIRCIVVRIGNKAPVAVVIKNALGVMLFRIRNRRKKQSSHGTGNPVVGIDEFDTVGKGVSQGMGSGNDRRVVKMSGKTLGEERIPPGSWAGSRNSGFRFQGVQM